MAPIADPYAQMSNLATRAVVVRAVVEVTRRGLSVNSAQKVTLGIIAVYVVVIALLWNLPYVRWSLWPFKVLHIPPCLLSTWANP